MKRRLYVLLTSILVTTSLIGCSEEIQQTQPIAPANNNIEIQFEDIIEIDDEFEPEISYSSNFEQVNNNIEIQFEDIIEIDEFELGVSYSLNLDRVICETKDHEKVLSLFENSSDISDSFTNTEMSFDENTVSYSVGYVDMKDWENYISTEKFVRTNTSDKILLQCTWAPSGESMYVGLLSDNNHLYYFELLTGSAYGILSLEDIPEGEYDIITYSACEHDLQGMMNYQVRNF